MVSHKASTKDSGREEFYNTFNIHSSSPEEKTPPKEIEESVKETVGQCPDFISLLFACRDYGWLLTLKCNRRCEVCTASIPKGRPHGKHRKAGLMKKDVYIKRGKLESTDECIHDSNEDSIFKLIRCPKPLKFRLDDWGQVHHTLVYWRMIKKLLDFYEKNKDRVKDEDEKIE